MGFAAGFFANGTFSFRDGGNAGSSGQIKFHRVTGASVTTSVSTMSVGPYYVPLAGTFLVTVEGASTPQLPYAISASGLQAALTALPTVVNVTVVSTSGLIDHGGRLYRGNQWNVSFNVVQQANFNGVVDMRLVASGLAGYAPNAQGLNLDSASPMVALHEL
jgi:hypothetical protein